MDEPNLFRLWKTALGITNNRAAELLGKSVRRIEDYSGGERPPASTLMLMAAIAEGARPKPFNGAHND